MGNYPATVLCALPSLVLIPIAIYGNIKLYKFRNEQFMKKRSLGIVFGLNISCTAMMLFYPLVPIFFFYFPLMNNLGFIFVFINWWFVLLLFNVRNWLIYFKSHWTHNTVQLEWQQIINPDIKNQKNWFIDNKKTYGNTLFIVKRFICIHIIGFIISLIGVSFRVTGYTSHKSSIITLLSIPLIIISLLIPIIFYIIILWKTPTFDSFYIFIHWESKLQAKLLILSIIVFFVVMSIGEF
eukprot:274041_1